MYAMRKSDLKSFTPNSKSVCRIDDGNTNAYMREDRFIEEFLGEIEPKYNRALAKLAEGKIDRASIFTIAGFVAYVLTCSPAGMRIFSGSLRAFAENFAISAVEMGHISLPPEELAGQSLADLFREGALEIVVDPKYPQAIGINSILRNIAAFGNFRWEILLNLFSWTPFFTSDYPVTVESTGNSRILNRIAPLAPNLAIRIIPDITIDLKRVDFGFANFSYKAKCISHKEVVEINRLIVRCAEDTVFYQDDLPWVRKFIAKNRHYRVETMNEKLPADNGFFHFSTQSIAPYDRSE